MTYLPKCLGSMSQCDVRDIPRGLGVADRRAVVRVKQGIPTAIERRTGKGRRKDIGKQRRRVDPTTCQREYTLDEIDFMMAMDQHKREKRRPYPSWIEVLEVLRGLGYVKVVEPETFLGA